MKKAVSIKLHRAEGMIHEIETVELKGDGCWKAAWSILFRWSGTAPRNGGYDKCDFTVTYEDGETYNGRYDLVHFLKEGPNLERHIRDHVECYSGRKVPVHYAGEKRADWDRYFASVDEETKKSAADFLDNYEIGASS